MPTAYRIIETTPNGERPVATVSNRKLAEAITHELQWGAIIKRVQQDSIGLPGDGYAEAEINYYNQ